MAYYDFKTKTFYITQSGNQRNKIKNIKGAEPITKNGNVRLRSGKIRYGLGYTKHLIKSIDNRSKIRGGNGKFWKIKVLEVGKLPFGQGFGKAKKIQTMGKIRFRHTPHKYQGFNQLSWSKTQDNIKRRRK